MYKLFYFLIFTTLISCNLEEKVKNKYNSKSVEKKKKKDGLSIKKHKNGKIKSSINYKMGVKHGVAKTFYSNGNLKLIGNYIDGQKDGITKYYYEDGNLFKETPYKLDKVHGIKKRFNIEGMIMSEAPYQNDAPGIMLKEYLTNGKEKTKYPKIIVKEENKLLFDNKFYLHISLSEKVKNPEFYRGKLKDGKWLQLSPEIGRLQTKDKKGIIVYPIPKGYSVMEKVPIIVTYKTRLGNTKILKKVYNLAVDNVN